LSNAAVTTFLELANETLAAAIVIVATSMLLYNLTRNLRNRVARTSAIVLACVTITYVCDVFISLEPSFQTWEATLRLQWVGIAFMPAAMFHLSDSLLATTGLMSRGRRRRVVRILYLISTGYLILAAFTNTLIEPVQLARNISLQAGFLFPLYLAYLLIATGAAFINIQRARLRCRTRDTRRRMGYLQFAILTPVIGIFPFSAILPTGEEFSLIGLLLVNVANLVVILMLLFLAYPLSFFGSSIPDRAVKTELLRFIMRGPGTALVALVVMIYITPATRILGLPGQTFVPFGVVTVVLFWQWLVAIALPWLEKKLVYADEDSEQLTKLQRLSDRLLSRNDLLQLMEANLAASCDFLRISTAFVVNFNDNLPELVTAVGPTRPTASLLEDEAEKLPELLEINAQEGKLQIIPWHSYWITPLYSRRNESLHPARALIGFMGIQARSSAIDLSADELQMFNRFVRRAAQTLDNILFQSEIYAALEGLLPQISLTRSRAAEVEYRPGRTPNPENGLDREQFVEQVKAALRHYWGGPGLTSSRLLELNIVQSAIAQNGDNPVRALRSVLQKAIERLRPVGERKMMSPEWTLYNILELRFIERRKVLDVAPRLALGEADFYRKQRIAIEAVADVIIEMEYNNGHDVKSANVTHDST
jgi:hypothetical protein